MAEGERRRLTISDIMVLVAMIAVEIVWLRFIVSFQDSAPFPYRQTAAKVYIGSIWVVLITMLALIPIRLRCPRPSVARLWRQPGWLACNAVALTFAISFCWSILSFIDIVRAPSDPRLAQLINSFLFQMTFQLGQSAMIAVAAAWATLALVVGWESEKVWIDRAGRWCGLCLLVHPILGLIHRALL